MTKRDFTKIFKQAGLSKDQINYAHTLRSMYSKTPIEKIIEMAKDYQSLTVVMINGK